MIFLDTHIVVWLYAGLVKKLSNTAVEIIEENEIIISQMVRLELQYLFEIGRITVTADDMINELKQVIGLKLSKKMPEEIFSKAIDLSWTRDVFDRLIVAEASTQDAILLTKDKKIQEHYNKAVW